jgi:uncharacterized Tic20 family protein
LALQQARYDEAIAYLERFCQETVNRQSKQFFQAQMWLIQAYHKDHKDLHAIALCEQLVKSDIPQVKQWADKVLIKLMDAAPSPSPVPTPSLSEPTAPTHSHPSSISAVEAHNPLPAASSEPTDQNAATSAPPATSFAQVSPQRVTSRHSHRTPKPKDYTGQIMGAIAHGSISILASILLLVLFSDSVTANGLGIARFVVPLLIFFTTQDAGIKENAREAVNYVLTCLILLIPLGLASIFLVVILVAAWPLAILLGLVVGAYLTVLSVYPVVATILCITKQDYVFRYPNWLILHLV